MLTADNLRKISENFPARTNPLANSRGQRLSLRAMNRRQRDRLPAPPEEPLDIPCSQAAGELAVQVQSLLHPDFVSAACAAIPGQKCTRERKLTLPAMALLLVSFCTSRLSSFAQLLTALMEGTLTALPAMLVTRQAFYQRLKAFSHGPFLSLLKQVTSHFRIDEPRRAWVAEMAPWAQGIFALDDTTLDALARRIPELAAFPAKSTETLAGKLAALLDVSTGKLFDILYNSNAGANEKAHVFPMLEQLPVSSLVIMDMGYFAFEVFDWMTQNGRFFLSRWRKKATYTVAEVLVDKPLYRDRLIYPGKYRADRGAHPVRLVELYLNGEWWSYLTNQLDPLVFPAEAVWKLYSQRWTIETTFNVIKRVLGLATFRASQIDGFLSQVWATLTVYQVLQHLRLQVAHARGLREDDISWQRMVLRISLYTQVPAPKPEFTQWLLSRQQLCKQGTRKRRAERLPADVLKDCKEGRQQLEQLRTQAPQQKLKPRKSRKGDKTKAGPQVVTLTNLSKDAVPARTFRLVHA
jgi:hypothetical protein